MIFLLLLISIFLQKMIFLLLLIRDSFQDFGTSVVLEKIDEQEGFELFGTTDSREPENAVEILEQREQKLLFDESTELGRASNLRKSLDWDSAFFTSARVLDPKELFIINKGFEKAEAHLLPEIQEDLCRWRYADSKSTLDSDDFSLDSNQSTEVDLFEGIRASIGKSNIMSDICKSGVGKAHKRDTHLMSEKIDEQEGFKLFGTTDSREPENAIEILEEREQKLLFYESTELGRASNLHKSLDWDSGFFTSARFEKVEAHLFPEVQEDLRRWRYTDSESTLDGDDFSLDSNQSTEVDLFEEIRASIEKSNIMSDICKSGVGEAHKRDTHLSEKIDEQEGFKLFGTTDSREPDNAVEILEEMEQKLLFYESTELGRASNLRKSLDWDSGFFTSTGVLDPEELFVINKGFEKTEAFLLPEVQEDLCRWRYADSEYTLGSDDFSLDSNQSTEVDLFEGIRASIEKSNIM